MFRVVATARSFCNNDGPHHDYLHNNNCEVDLCPPKHPLPSVELKKLIRGYDGIILGLDECDSAVINHSDKLRVISRYGAGIDQVDIDAASTRGIIVTNTPGTNRIAVAELTFGLMFALLRNIPKATYNAQSSIWQRYQGYELYGKSLGIIGFGFIGREVAKRARCLGMHVLVHSRHCKKAAGVSLVNLDTLLRESDILTLHTSLTPENRDLIGTEQINQMKDGAYIINTARGELINEESWYQALKSGKLAGGAADVFREEPPKNNPLLTLDNFMATLHMGSTTKESIARMAMMASENLLAILRGQHCDYVVNKEALEVVKKDAC
ncbi:phosphoglycerate dehydrogenase [Chloroflexota bacterium]